MELHAAEMVSPHYISARASGEVKVDKRLQCFCQDPSVAHERRGSMICAPMMV